MSWLHCCCSVGGGWGLGCSLWVSLGGVWFVAVFGSVLWWAVSRGGSPASYSRRGSCHPLHPSAGLTTPLTPIYSPVQPRITLCNPVQFTVAIYTLSSLPPHLTASLTPFPAPRHTVLLSSSMLLSPPPFHTSAPPPSLCVFYGFSRICCVCLLVAVLSGWFHPSWWRWMLVAGAE